VTLKWEKLPKMHMKRDELAACIGPDGMIYAVGGYGGGDNSSLASVERFNVHSQKWELIAPLREARRALTAVALPDGIYAIGGFNGEQYRNVVEKYDFENNEWLPVTPMISPRCTLSCVVSPDYMNIYAIGGFNGQPLKSVEKFNIHQEKWEELPPMKHARFMHSCIVVSV